ncbi:MAG: tRNA guanosine(34) transglycosylase Tgt [Bacteroidales bacterium]
MEFRITEKDKKSFARAGEFSTAHGRVETPVFMPVGTAGTVKAVHMRDVREDTGASVILGNTYHLYLRPGLEIIEKSGGLHAFNGWQGPMLTDSGGYQVHSLADIRKIEENGVAFQSHIDGSRHFYSPEYVIDIQRIIGADIMMAFDECTSYPCDIGYAREAMCRTHRWLDRSLAQFDRTEPKYGYRQTIFPIVQGSVYADLRRESAEYIASKEREGNAIGGLSVGEPAELMYEMTAQVCEILPEDKPRYLMGVGTPANILESIALGVDMFDCVMPTRNGRNGMLFTAGGIMNMKNHKWKDDLSPLDPNGLSFVDSQYSKAFVRHLYAANESLGPMIGSLHNLGFYMWLVREARKHIQEKDFALWKNSMVSRLQNRL